MNNKKHLFDSIFACLFAFIAGMAYDSLVLFGMVVATIMVVYCLYNSTQRQ